MIMNKAQGNTNKKTNIARNKNKTHNISKNHTSQQKTQGSKPRHKIAQKDTRS